MKNYGHTNCPCCDASQSFYKSEGKESANGKLFYRKVQYLARVIVVKDPLPIKEGQESHEGKIRVVGLNRDFYAKIMGAITSASDPLPTMPDDLKQGFNFIIRKEKDGDYASYDNSGFARNPSPVSIAIDPEKDSLLVALAKIGGLSRDEAISHGVDKAMLGHRPIFGKLLFRTDGKSFDSAAEALAQDNYPVFEDDQYNDAGLHGGNGRSHTGKALLLALTDALNGNDIGTPQYYVAKAQKAFEEEQEQARIDALFDGKGNSKADWLDDVSAAHVDELIENPSTATEEVIEVIQNDAGTET